MLALACLLACTLLAACGGNDDPQPAEAGDVGVATGVSTGSAGEAERSTAAAADGANAVRDAIRAMAASEGMYFGEVPENFPLELLPLHPDGTIDKSAIGDGEATLLQQVAGDKNSVLSWYSEHYRRLGWSADDPVSAMGRTMVSFEGPDASVSMTLIEREDGTTFVALALD
jgi:hypothetical protein